MASDPVRLLARGVPVTLSDGVERHLVIDLEALCVIEERSGSLLTFLEQGNRSFRGKLLNYVRTGLVAGLAHLKGTEQMPEASILPLIDFRDLEAVERYRDAIAEAVDQALPSKGEAPASGKASKRTSASTGTTSTTSEPSSSDEATASSGA